MATRDRRNTEPGMRSTAQTDHAITIETAPMPAVDPRDAFLAGLAARESASQGAGQNAAFVEEDTDLDVATVPTDGLDDALPDLSDILMPHEEAERGAFGLPVCFVEEQMFFGNDRLTLLEATYPDGTPSARLIAPMTK